MKKAIAYYRASTGRQKRSGLGLEAQRKAVTDFATINRYKLIDYFTEIESGKRNDRPALISALRECEEKNAVLLIAALDRLSRSVAFTSALMETNANFKLISHPNADDFTIHILAAVAQKERMDNSKRTIAALAAAKRRGTQLGPYGKYVLSNLNKVMADHFAWAMEPIIGYLRRKGIRSVRSITEALNKMKVPTFRKRGHKWHPTTVQNLLKRFSQKHN